VKPRAFVPVGFVGYAQGQATDQTITGKVIDEKGDGLPGVNILIVGKPARNFYRSKRSVIS
jgi:hypothetical protein